MMQYLWTVLTNCTDGEDAEFNRWYNDVHIPDLLNIPGVVSAQRFELAPEQVRTSDQSIVGVNPAVQQHRYLAIYNIETDDPTSVLKDLLSRAGTDKMPMTEHLLDDTGFMCFQAIAPLQAK